jgi:hypothetical protein
MRQAKILRTTILYKELEKVITIAVNEKEIKVNKWIKTDNIESDYDSNWKFSTEKDKQVYDELTDEQRDEVDDIIAGIDL